MTADTRPTAADELLRARRADSIAHPGGTLLGHLRRVQALLDAWGASLEVQLAGLCHAFYGTDGFPTALLDITERPVLTAVVGARAEALVYVYASCDRARTYPQLGGPVVEVADRFTGQATSPDHQALCAFVEITAANELDVIRHNQTIATQHGPSLQRLFTEARWLLSPAAAEAWDRAVDPPAELTMDSWPPG